MSDITINVEQDVAVAIEAESSTAMIIEVAEQGPSGPSGTSGTSGTSGISGSSGTSGTSGTSSDGTSGTSGTSGSSGTSALGVTSGTSGTSGIDGVDGTSGTSGVDGTSGSSGTSGEPALLLDQSTPQQVVNGRPIFKEGVVINMSGEEDPEHTGIYIRNDDLQMGDEDIDEHGVYMDLTMTSGIDMSGNVIGLKSVVNINTTNENVTGGAIPIEGYAIQVNGNSEGLVGIDSEIVITSGYAFYNTGISSVAWIDVGSVVYTILGIDSWVYIEEGSTVEGDVIGHYNIVDVLGTVEGLSYGYFLEDTTSELDYGYYQSGTSPNHFGGNIETDGDIVINDENYISTIKVEDLKDFSTNTQLTIASGSLQTQIDNITISGGGVTAHSNLTELDYASSGHTGFQPAGNYITDAEMTIIIGDITAQIPTDFYSTNEVDTISGSLHQEILDVGGISSIEEDLTPKLGGDLDLNSKSINYGTILTVSGTYVGDYIQVEVDDDNTVFGNVLYQADDFHYDRADADASATSPAFVMALSPGSGTRNVLMRGQVCDTSWSWSAGKVYLSTSTGSMTQTVVSDTGDVIQVLGFALSANTVWFEPVRMIAEVA